jgi:hypothetical protein
VKFKDSTGREWVWPKITTRLLNTIKDEHKMDLRDLLREDSHAIGVALIDDERLISLLCFLCKRQMEEQAIDRDVLEEAWDGETNLAARESLIEHFFVFSQGQKKAKLLMARRAAMENHQTSNDSATNSPEQPEESTPQS